MPLTPGQILNNRYRILQLLGQGGFGTVYQAVDQAFGVPCAVKECLHSTVEAQEQFQREAVMLRTLRHPNLPVVLDYFVVPTGQGDAPGGQTAYLVMDFIEGHDLDEMLDRNGGPLQEAQALTWTGQVCDALIYLHKQNPPVIHRDIKPTNIRITPASDAILVDFGIAKQYQADKATMVAAQAYTPGFSPIEQYGSGGRTDARTDVYALGATLYVLLTGRRPTEATHRSPDEPLTLVRELNNNVSPHVEQAVMRALELYPSQRFAGVAEFKTALLAKEPLTMYVSPAAQAAPGESKAEQSPAAPPSTLPGATGYLPAQVYPVPRKPPAKKRQAFPITGLALLAGVAALGLIGMLVGSILANQSAAVARQTAAAQTQSALNGLAGTSVAGTQAAQETRQAQEQSAGTATQADFATAAALSGQQTQAAGTAVIQSMLNAEGTAMAATQTAAPTPTLPQDSTRARIPAGEFQMGSPAGEEDEQPVHAVSLPGFSIDLYEVTNAQFAAFLNVAGNQDEGGVPWLDAEVAGGHLFKDGFWQADRGFADHPVVNASWYGAQAYCRWAGGRLPAEAEWEKAARGGLSGAVFPWGNEGPACKTGANRGAQSNNCDGGTVPVGSFGPNGYGLFDMAGNVAEWVADWYSKDYYAGSPSSSPSGPDTGEVKVLRGGSWDDSPGNLTVSYRNWLAPYDVSSSVGFRCVYGQ